MLVAGEQDALALLLAHLVRDQAMTAFTTIVTTAITDQVLAPALEGAQADADLTAGTHQPGARGLCLPDQLDRLPPVQGSSQPSASSEQKAFHFCRSTSKAAIFAMAFPLRCSSFLRALISGLSWARSLSSSFCSAIVSTGWALASWDACPHRLTCSGKRPRSRQYALSSVAFNPAVSSTTMNLSISFSNIVFLGKVFFLEVFSSSACICIYICLQRLIDFCLFGRAGVFS